MAEMLSQVAVLVVTEAELRRIVREELDAYARRVGIVSTVQIPSSEQRGLVARLERLGMTPPAGLRAV